MKCALTPCANVSFSGSTILGKVLDLGGLDLGDNANSLVHVVRNVGVVRAGIPTTGGGQWRIIVPSLHSCPSPP